ncbi:hypothetical protein [Hymenobacter crusticola]|uniref:Phytase-like domain-containing protein n=1 Tax=Hymenobacter crusticola TaxID=1770526 RepID=A0A243W5M9_9BACT|nr:hypothetical protein [Hymenobacter crusticola]OUJ68946.1 hypothetical protein BXP70_27270 [Hymenobacter crusticola]
MTYPLPCGKHQIVDLDADEEGNYLALLSHGEVWTPTFQVPLPYQFRFPLIRALDNTRFLIVEARSRLEPNGHIFDYAGTKLLSFEAGDGIADVLVQARQIVVSYFDEGVASDKKPSSDGLAVFDFTGQQRYGLNSSQSYFLLDCYALCKLGRDRVLAYTYTGFPLLELGLNDCQLRRQPTPADFEGAQALTTSHQNVVFYGSYQDKTSFFWWDRQKKVTRFGQWPAAPLRGIGDGKFLTFDAQSFTIIDAMELMREEVALKHKRL